MTLLSALPLAAALAQTATSDCEGSLASLRLSHPRLSCSCASPDAVPDCTEGGEPSAGRTTGSSRKADAGTAAAAGALKSYQQDLDAMYRRAPGIIQKKAAESAVRSQRLDAHQRHQAGDAERVLGAAREREKAAQVERRRRLGVQLLAPPPRPAGAKLGAVMPPLGERAEAVGRALQVELDAGRAVETVEELEGKLKEHARGEYARAGWEKAKAYLEDKSEALGKHIDAIERVKEQGSILKDYAGRTLDAFKTKASGAACALGTGAAACLEAYHAADRRQDRDRDEFARRTHDYIGEQFLVSSPDDEAEGIIAAAKDDASAAAARRFFGRF